MSLINRTNNVLRRRRLQINGEMLDDIRRGDLEEFGVGASIQRRKLLRVVKRAQEERVDVSNFSRSDLLSFAKRVREIQRERLKGVKGIDLSFLDRPLLEDFDNTAMSDENDGTGLFRMFLIAILVCIVAIGYQNGHYDNLSSIVQKKFVASFSSPSPSPSPLSSRSIPSTNSRSIPSTNSRSQSTPSTTSSSSSSTETAQKCFSMAHSARKWKHEYKYPDDVEDHYEQLLDLTQPFRVQPFHDYAGYAGPWIENHWIFNFMGKPLSDFGPYIPLFVRTIFRGERNDRHSHQLININIYSKSGTMDRHSIVRRTHLRGNRERSTQSSET